MKNEVVGQSVGFLLEGIHLEMRLPIFQINEVISELYNCRMADMPVKLPTHTYFVCWGCSCSCCSCCWLVVACCSCYCYYCLLFVVCLSFLITIPWVVPLPSNSHHQDHYIFTRESQPKPSFATVIGRGDNPNYSSLTKKTYG